MTMSTWTESEFDAIAAATELRIRTQRPDGTLRPAVPIWVVQAGNGIYVRSYAGPGGGWLRTATARGTARIHAGSVDSDVTVTLTGTAARADIDGAYRAKYGRYGSAYVEPMTADTAAATTLLLSRLGERTPVMTSNSHQASQPQANEQSGAAKMFGDFAPGLVTFTDDVLFGHDPPELSPRDRSLVTVTALATAGNTEQLTYHLGLARQNGVAETELIEAITHLAFYAGWPRAMSAVAKDVFRSS